MMIMNFNAEAAKAAVKNCEAMRQAALIEAAEKKVSSHGALFLFHAH